jgi:hypothetical protein
MIAFAREEVDGGDSRCVMSLEKNNLGRLGLPSHEFTIQPVTIDTPEGPSYVSRFVLGPETSTSVRDVMREEIAPDTDRGETNETVEWLRAYLTDQGGADLAADVKAAARKDGISDSSLQRARRKLGVKMRHSGFGKNRRSEWSLPGALTEDGEQ